MIKGTELTNKVVDDALSAGYRLFDTAHMYNNEQFLGQAFKELLPKHDLTRNDIFITTKFGKVKVRGGSLEDKFFFDFSSVDGLQNGS